MKSSDDLVYEQDILRDPTSVRPWVGYIDFKHQHGSLLEQAFVWQFRQLSSETKMRLANKDFRLWSAPACIYPGRTSYGRW